MLRKLSGKKERCRLVIDARPEQRFSGERETLDKVAGHIPGAINWVFEENLDFDGTYLPADELREAYVKLLHVLSRKMQSMYVVPASPLATICWRWKLPVTQRQAVSRFVERVDHRSVAAGATGEGMSIAGT